jgi:hypothetical protein
MLANWCLVLALGLVVHQEKQDSVSPATKPTLTVSVRSIDSILDSVHYVLNTVGAKEEVNKFDTHLKTVLPKGFEGIDTKRPIGLFGKLDPDGNVAESTALLMVPIADEKAFLGLLTRLGIEPEKDEGVFSFSPPNSPITVYFRFANKYLYATVQNKAVIAPAALPKPETALPAQQPGLVALSFHFDQIPNAYKQIALGQIENQASNLAEQNVQAEDEVQHAGRVAGIELVSKTAIRLLEECTNLAVQIDVDAKLGNLVAEASISAKSGSSLAKDIAALAPSDSMFAALEHQDSAVTLLVNGGLPTAIRDVFIKGFDVGFKKSLTEQKDEKKRAQGKAFYDVLVPTLKSGLVHGALNFHGPNASGNITLVGAAQVKEGKKLEAVVLDLAKKEAAENKKAPKVESAVETFKGVAIHKVEPTEKMDDKARAMFGTNPFYFAIRDDAAFVTGGAEGLAAMKDALGASPGKAPPLKMEFAMARVAGLIQDQDKEKTTAAAHRAFPKGSDGSDKLRLVLEGGPKLSLRFETTPAVLHFVTLVGENKKADK